MKFLDKLASFLDKAGITEQDIFIHWLIKQAQLDCKTDAIKIFPGKALDEVIIDAGQLSESDLKKLQLYLMLPENTHPIDSKITVNDLFLCKEILPKFKDHIRNSDRKKSEKESHELIISPVDETDDGFVIIDCYEDEDSEDIKFDDSPWLDPQHPLYFPSQQPRKLTSLTRWDAIDKFSVENWYHHLKKYTFDSYFVTLNYNDILFLIGSSLPEYDPTELERTLDDILLMFKNSEVFMRLSTRSPKDSKHLFDEAATIMSRDFSYWNETGNKNQQLVSFVVSMTKAMKITSGKKIIDAITSSPRVFSDLLALISQPDSSDKSTKIILREWYNIRPDHEFRVFVSRRCRKESIVTAISQYFHFLYFDKAPEDCFNFLDERSKKNIVLKFQNYVLKLIDPEIAKFLHFSSKQDNDNSPNCIREYIVDLALIPIDEYHGDVTEDNKITIGENTYIIMVIELNPFAPSATGSLLFNWKTDLDTLWGKAPCEYPIFNYRTKPRTDFHSITLLPANYEHVIENALTKRLTSSPHADIKEPSSVIASSGSTKQDNRFFPVQPTVTSSSEDLITDSKSLV